MSTKQDLITEYKAQMLRVYGMCTEDMKAKIDAMGEEKLSRDLDIIRAYPNKERR
jgi:hypothetical protein